MTDQLELVCAESRNQRPRMNDDLRRLAAKEIVAIMIRDGSLRPNEDDESVEDIVKVTRINEDDGYRIAKALDERCCWDCDMKMVEQLDQFCDLARSHLERAEKQWAEANPRESEFPIGVTVMWRNKPASIVGIDSRPQCYQLRQGEMPANSYYVVPFEGVSACARDVEKIAS